MFKGVRHHVHADSSLRARSLRSRLSRAWLRCSLLLLVALGIYWPIAAHVAGNLQSLDGSDKLPAIAAGLGHHELAWVVESHALTIWHAADPAGGTLPLVNRYGFLRSLFQALKFEPKLDQTNHRLLDSYFITFRTKSSSTGSPVTIHLLSVPLLYLLIGFSIWPAWALISRSRQALAAYRIFRRRRIRNAMGHCSCGYDLRQSQARCPECGRAFRRVPVPVV